MEAGLFMLTRPLMRQRIHEGRLLPLFIDATSKGLRELAGALIDAMEAGVGGPRAELEEQLSALSGASRQPQVARGLTKLLLDRATFEAADPDAVERRRGWLDLAQEVRGTLTEGATPEDFEAALEARLELSLTTVREQLFSDLSAVRPLLSWKAIDAATLLERYNLALAQTPLLEASRVRLTAPAPSLLAVRKLLRWLRFCRLVAEVRQEGTAWVLEAEGPGAVVGMHKKYGLQLANFLAGVPVLGTWQLTATLSARGREVQLSLSDADPVVSPLPNAQGWLPPALRTLAAELEGDPSWEVDLLPMPRPSGMRGVCVPDLLLKERKGAREIAVELFHRWHAGALNRRLADLEDRPDPGLILGVERALVRNAELKATLTARDDVFLFSEFPTARKLRALLPDRG